jgi:hypothetical protein
MTATKLTADEALTIARDVTGDRATLSLHQATHNAVGIRVTGCIADDGRAVVMDIARALETAECGTMHPDDLDFRASRRVATAAGFVACWL